MTADLRARPATELSQLARAVHRVLRESRNGSLLRGSIARAVGAGRWKKHSHAELERALDELERAGLVTDDNYGRYTLTGGTG